MERDGAHRETHRETWDRRALIEQIRRAKGRGQKVRALHAAERYLRQNPNDREVKEVREELDERLEWWFYLRIYLPAFLILWPVTGLASGGRWGVAAVAAAVAAIMASAVVAVVVDAVTDGPHGTED